MLSRSHREKISFFLFLYLWLLACLPSSDARRDPFIPLVNENGLLMPIEENKAKEGKGLSLEGIIYDANGISYCLVNGETLRVGDEIEGYQVLKVLTDRVILVKDGNIKEIVLEEEGK